MSEYNHKTHNLANFKKYVQMLLSTTYVDPGMHALFDTGRLALAGGKLLGAPSNFSSELLYQVKGRKEHVAWKGITSCMTPRTVPGTVDCVQLTHYKFWRRRGGCRQKKENKAHPNTHYECEIGPNKVSWTG
jgi:hypothetical protein